MLKQRSLHVTRAIELADQLARIEPARLAAIISLLPLEQAHAAVVGAEVAYLRAERRLRDDYPGGRFHRLHTLLDVQELDLLRYPPNGDRDQWVRGVTA
jgi:hypothetical protein